MTPGVIILILAGAGAGLGLFVILREFTPGVPALGPALRQLHAPTSAGSRPAAAAGPLGWLGSRLRIPHRELALIGHSPERFVAEKVGFAMVGLLFPPVFSLILVLSGLRLGIVIPPRSGSPSRCCSSSSSTCQSASAPPRPARSSAVTSRCTST